ncbi:hypothetical protein RvY_08069 [Ramazzottius varieornatus]|uniref:CUE domain-containing protein n=1 Tax=Ramazzottius varieornatus TaxID=947166 RepID=A0A1D1V4L0_RAMVA|nr:hypothetical protein RvY_08069 [Ramazzottius varieornatus]
MEYASTTAWSAGASTSQSGFSSSSSAGGHVAEQAKLDFDQAMQDFQTMFPDMDRDLIEQILRANNGAVERTIDELLALNSQPGASLTVNVSTSSSETAPAVPPRPIRRKRWYPPLVGPLPEGFLRLSLSQPVRMPHQAYNPPRSNEIMSSVGPVIDPKKTSSSSSISLRGKFTSKKKSLSPATPALSTSPETASHFNEENFNNLMQDEDFLTELQKDEEFMQALQKDAKARAVAGRENSAFLPGVDNSPNSGAAPHEDATDFQSKLKKNMGMSSKQRLSMFTKQLSLGKKKSAKNIMNKANPSSYDHLIEDSNSLVSDDDDDHLAEGTSHVRLEKKNSQI